MSTASDAIEIVVRRAAAEGVREALGVADVTNRRLMKVKEAATYLALSAREIYVMIAAGELPPVKRGRMTMIDIQDLDRWIARNKG